MGRRRRSLQRTWLAMLMLAGLFVAVPASTSEQDVIDGSLGPGCGGASVVGVDGDIEWEGAANGGALNCPGAPTGCLDYM